MVAKDLFSSAYLFSPNIGKKEGAVYIIVKYFSMGMNFFYKTLQTLMMSCHLISTWHEWNANTGDIMVTWFASYANLMMLQ